MGVNSHRGFICLVSENPDLEGPGLPRLVNERFNQPPSNSPIAVVRKNIDFVQQELGLPAMWMF